MKFIKKIVLNVVLWFLVCLVATAIIIFIGNVLFIFHLIFRSIFWQMFIYGGIGILSLEILWLIFVKKWQKVYKEYLKMGKSERAAFESACETQCRLPKWFLKKIKGK